MFCMYALGVAAFQLKFGPVEYCIRWTVSLNIAITLDGRGMNQFSP